MLNVLSLVKVSSLVIRRGGVITSMFLSLKTNWNSCPIKLSPNQVSCAEDGSPPDAADWDLFPQHRRWIVLMIINMMLLMLIILMIMILITAGGWLCWSRYTMLMSSMYACVPRNYFTLAKKITLACEKWALFQESHTVSHEKWALSLSVAKLALAEASFSQVSNFHCNWPLFASYLLRRWRQT